MKRTAAWVGGALALIAAAAALAFYLNPDQFLLVAGMGVNWVRYLSAPAGTLQTEVAAGAPSLPSLATTEGGKDWPSYNRTLTSNRFSSLEEITSSSAARLKVLCTF